MAASDNRNSDPVSAFYFLEDVILILEEENPESAARIMEAVTADMQSSGWAVLRTPANAFIAICEGMEHHFLPCKGGYVMKVYSKGEMAYHADVLHHLPEYE
jgi:hypothetical protein